MVGETLGKSVRVVCDACNTKCNIITQKAFHAVLHLYHAGSKFVYYFLYTAFPWVVLKDVEAQESKEAEGDPKEAEGDLTTTECDASHMKTE